MYGDFGMFGNVFIWWKMKSEYKFEKQLPERELVATQFLFHYIILVNGFFSSNFSVL